MIAARLRRDRGSIGPRSWSSSANPPSRPIELQVNGWSRSRDQVGHDCEERPPSDGGRSRSRSRCSPFDEDRDHPELSTCRPMSGKSSLLIL